MNNVSFAFEKQRFPDFEQKVSNEVLVEALWPHKRASCAPECDPLKDSWYSVEAQEGHMGGFWTPREWQKAPDPGPNLRSPCSVLPAMECQPLVFLWKTDDSMV